ncbi:hypothetical protein EAI_00211 [Harpegnathos saltator]|uniref:Mitochondrial splicing suppressor 51-like C-terminal domain-containing protein n=2 Tax=Harpegnathos saltator TaxID=610380 RepID=E2BP86_HARSA|nr:hypothetical protein EAI_00211 [Harpegnathos saltator]
MSAEFCLGHKEKFEQEHESECTNLLLWLNIQLSYFQIQSKISLSMKFLNFPDDNRPFDDMATFIIQYVQEEIGQWYAVDYIYTDYVSGPLTLHHGMKEAKLLHLLETGSIYIIHVVGANSEDRYGLPAWEMLLHLLPNIKILIIVFIGPDLQDELGIHELCLRCRNNKKKLIFECCPTFYHDYVAKGIYKQPNLIIGFNTLLSYTETWSESIIAMQALNCPILLTARDLITMEDEIDEIQIILDTAINPVFWGSNKFKSLRPHRYFNELYFRNSYLFIYDTLNNYSNEDEKQQKICKIRVNIFTL